MSKYILSHLRAIIIIAILIPQFGCDNAIKEHFAEIYTSEVYEGFYYDLSSPEVVLDLPPPLNEISGLSYFDENSVIAIQDERAIVYIVNLDDGSIRHQVKFGPSGDYEGIATVGDTVYVVSSSGKIYYFDFNIDEGEAKSGIIETSITINNDVEGLTYDKKRNRLLIACKGEGELGNNKAKGKSIYPLDLNTQVLEEIPVGSIRKKELEPFITKDYPNMKLKSGIGPSGIAIHPFTGKTFVLAHDGKAIVILDENGKIEKYIPLNPGLFQQPEGICFNQKGDMFISNEASFSRPNIMKFTYRP
jgi:uncharacterized protein YjiK